MNRLAAGYLPTETVRKPWGNELIFAAVDDGYVGKVITIDPGHSVSLQRHQAKSETVFVLEGSGTVELGPSTDELERLELKAGDCVHIPSPCVHRFSAATTLRFVEVSTASAGWRTDVERLDDSYGRRGSAAP